MLRSILLHLEHPRYVLRVYTLCNVYLRLLSNIRCVLRCAPVLHLIELLEEWIVRLDAVLFYLPDEVFLESFLLFLLQNRVKLCFVLTFSLLRLFLVSCFAIVLQHFTKLLACLSASVPESLCSIDELIDSIVSLISIDRPVMHKLKLLVFLHLLLCHLVDLSILAIF